MGSESNEDSNECAQSPISNERTKSIERVYTRSETHTVDNIISVAKAMLSSPALVGGSTKLDRPPGGGGRAGIFEKSNGLVDMI